MTVYMNGSNVSYDVEQLKELAREKSQRKNDVGVTQIFSGIVRKVTNESERDTVHFEISRVFPKTECFHQKTILEDIQKKMLEIRETGNQEPRQFFHVTAFKDPSIGGDQIKYNISWIASPTILKESVESIIEDSSSIKEIQTTLNEIKSFAQLRTIIEKVQVHLSFWGNRYITVAGYKGFLPIDALAQKVRELIEMNPHFDEVERAYGKDIVSPIDNIYTESDKQVEASHPLTRLFVRIQKIIVNISTINFFTLGKRRVDYSETRWDWRNCEFIRNWYGDFENGYYKVFYCYTQTQYERVFQIQSDQHGDQLNGLKEYYLLPPGKRSWNYGDWIYDSVSS